MITTLSNNAFVDTPRSASLGNTVDAQAPEEAQLRVFAMLWAIASLFHMAHSSVFDSQLDFALLTLAALYVVFRPSMVAFFVLIGLQVFDAFFRMPFTTNHWIFTAFVNVTMLHALGFLVIRQRTFQINGGDLLKTFAPLVKIELIVLYFFAVFHKLNTGFFADGSCATDLLRAQHIDNYIALPAGFYKVNAYLTLLIEALIPILLCFRKTRSVGLLLGVFFHFVLSYSSYNAFYDFSSMVFAVYFLFTNPGLSVRIVGHMRQLRSKIIRFVSPAEFSYARLVYLASAFILGMGIIYMLTKKLSDFKAVHLYFFWTVYAIAYVYFFVRCQLFEKDEQPRSHEDAHPRILHASLFIVPALVLLNGLSPYIGLKTENSYAMFSNLKTEGGSSNHLIMPASLQIFDYQKDVVRLVSSTDQGLQKLANANLSMVWFEFKNYVHERKPSEVIYLRNGKQEIYRRTDKGSHPPKNNYILAKLMKFRAFSEQGAQPCSH